MVNLGAAFGVPDYVWQPLPDGGVLLGSWAHSMFAGKPVDIPAEFSQARAGGNSMTLPMLQALRPGVVVNGRRLSSVRLENDDTTITWLAVNPLTGKAVAMTPAQRQIDAAYPELSAGLHLPKFARVEAHAEAVPLPVPMAGQDSGMFQFPPVGTLVEVAFTDGRPDKPFIR